MAKKENRFKDYDITTQAIHTGTDYDAETGAVRPERNDTALTAEIYPEVRLLCLPLQV